MNNNNGTFDIWSVNQASRRIERHVIGESEIDDLAIWLFDIEICQNRPWNSRYYDSVSPYSFLQDRCDCLHELGITFPAYCCEETSVTRHSRRACTVSRDLHQWNDILDKGIYLISRSTEVWVLL